MSVVAPTPIVVNSNPPQAGYGGDHGPGFHGSVGSRLPSNDPTEQTLNQQKLEDEEKMPEVSIPHHQYWHESPFTRYVSRPLSGGDLSSDLLHYKPEDRSQMGIPLNPFWIRNDLYGMEKYCDIFVQADSNFVQKRVADAQGPEAADGERGYARHTYLDDESQPQREGVHLIQESLPANLVKDTAIAPKAPAAGKVTGTEAAATMGEMLPGNSNPADVQNPNGEVSESTEPQSGKEGRTGVTTADPGAVAPMAPQKAKPIRAPKAKKPKIEMN